MCVDLNPICDNFSVIAFNSFSYSSYSYVLVTSKKISLNSTVVVGNDLSPWMIDFKFSQPWRKWSIWDIEREYLEILMLRGEPSSFAPALKFFKKDVLTMLNLLIDCDVIYNFKTRDLFVNNMKGELESYFRNFKKIRVQTL